MSKPYRMIASAQSPFQTKIFPNTNKKLLKNRNYRSALFHMKTRVSLKHFVNDFRLELNYHYEEQHKANQFFIYKQFEDHFSDKSLI